MLPIERGLEIVLTTAKSKDRSDWMPAESVPLMECISRVLREDVFADSDSPPFDKAIRDGFAVRSDDVMEIPATLSVIGESRAGLASNVHVQKGQCCEIMTGAPLPSGANAVVMVENTERLSQVSVRICKSGSRE